MDNCLINADIIVNNNGLFVIEIAARPSGHYLHDMFVPLCTGIDMASEYIKFQIGKEYTFKPKITRLLQIRFFDFENCIIESLPSEEIIRNSGSCRLIRWECNIKKGQYMGPVINGHSIMGRGYFIVEGESEEELESQTNWILGLFAVHTLPK